MYLLILLTLSFGALKSNAQTQSEVDEIKNYTAEFLKDKQDKSSRNYDKELIVKESLVKTAKEVDGWGSFGAYNTGKCING
jgi:hypothetical protein